MLAGNAAYDPGAFVSIASATGTGSSNTITFSSIPGTYQHLQIRITGQSTDTSLNTLVSLITRFNSDTAANYNYHTMYGDGTAVTASGNASTTSIGIFGTAWRSTTASNTFGVGIIDIHDYASTSKYKTIRSFSGGDANLGTAQERVFLQSGSWMSTSAITSISFELNNGNYATGSTFALYGIKGAQIMPTTYEPIATTTLGSAASTITFSSIPGTYTDLRLVVVARGTTASTGVGINLRFNSDSATNYSRTYLFGDGTSADTGRSTGSTAISGTMPGSSVASGIFAMNTLDIFSYAGSTNKTSLMTISKDMNNGGSDYAWVQTNLWRSTSAITTVTLTTASGNFDTGTTATLFGILKA